MAMYRSFGRPGFRRLEKMKGGEFVFPGQARNKPLSNMGNGNGLA
jgi:hypothetical protein